MLQRLLLLFAVADVVSVIAPIALDLFMSAKVAPPI